MHDDTIGTMDALRAELESVESQLLQARAESEEAREAHRLAEVGLESLRESANELVANCQLFCARLRECQTSISELEGRRNFRRHEASQPVVRQQQRLLKAQRQESEVRSEVQKAQAKLNVALNERKKLADELDETRKEIERAEAKNTALHSSVVSPRRSRDTEALARKLSVTSPQTQVFTMIDSDDESQAGGSHRNSIDSWNSANFATAGVDRISQRSMESMGAALGVDQLRRNSADSMRAIESVPEGGVLELYS